ncbi:hnRNP-associated with lethal yellow, isoform CRA_a, partial [Mus musculus]
LLPSTCAHLSEHTSYTHTHTHTIYICTSIKKLGHGLSILSGFLILLVPREPSHKYHSSGICPLLRPLAPEQPFWSLLNLNCLPLYMAYTVDNQDILPLKEHILSLPIFLTLR